MSTRTTRRDTSNDDAVFATRLANRGYTEEKIFRALAAKPSGRRDRWGSLKYQRLLDEKGRDRADSYARRTAASAIAFVQENPRILDRSGALVRILEIEATADALPWGIYGGPAARRALEACFVAAEICGGVSFGLPLRRWALLAGQGFRSIQHHRDRLKRLGWVRQTPNDRPGRTARFRLRVPGDISTVQAPGHFSHQGGLNVPGVRARTCDGIHASAPVTVCEPGAGCKCPRGLLNHDVFRPEALGDVGWLVLGAVTGPTTVRELALRTGVDIDDLGPILDALEGAVGVEDQGLVVPAPDPLPTLQEIAQARGTAGALQADRERFEAERDAWHERGEQNGGGA